MAITIISVICSIFSDSLLEYKKERQLCHLIVQNSSSMIYNPSSALLTIFYFFIFA